MFKQIQKLFTKKEALGLTVILVIILGFMLFNFGIAERKARDAERKDDVRSISNALKTYHDDFGSYPLSQDGKIVGCDSGKKDAKGKIILRGCEWGQDSLDGVKLAIDPRHGQGHHYYYLSDGRYYQVYAALEGKDEAEYDPKIIARNLPCGDFICNFGLSSGLTPLDKSLQEYENEIDAKTAPATK